MTWNFTPGVSSNSFSCHEDWSKYQFQWLPLLQVQNKKRMSNSRKKIAIVFFLKYLIIFLFSFCYSTGGAKYCWCSFWTNTNSNLLDELSRFSHSERIEKTSRNRNTCDDKEWFVRVWIVENEYLSFINLLCRWRQSKCPDWFIVLIESPRLINEVIDWFRILPQGYIHE